MRADPGITGESEVTASRTPLLAGGVRFQMRGIHNLVFG